MASINNMNTIYADKIYLSSSTVVSEISDQFATISYVDTNSGGISQQDVDDTLAPLISKDIAYNSTLQSHISLIDTNTTDIATHTNDIAVLNTKQIQNFAGITDINTNLTNNYQTTTQRNSNFVSPITVTTNHYTKSEIDTALSNYTSAIADTLFYSQTYINNNIYTNTEVDGLVGAGGGYTDTEIDNLLDLRVPKSDFFDRFSTFPVIECAPTFIHSGLTLKKLSCKCLTIRRVVI